MQFVDKTQNFIFDNLLKNWNHALSRCDIEQY